MDLVPVFTILREKRLLVAISFLVAIGIATFMVLGSRQYLVGVAQQNVLIDTPKSSAADLNPSGTANAGASNSLVNQATLLANLMLSTGIEDSIAQQVGIPTSHLSVVNSATTGLPVISTELATTDAHTLPPSKAYDLTITTNPGLSILTFSTQAPTAKAAASLANATTNALREYIHNDAAAQSIPTSQLTVVSPLGPPQAGLVQHGPKKLYAAIAAALTFVLLCSLIVFFTGRAQAARLALAVDSERDRQAESAEAITGMPLGREPVNEAVEEPLGWDDVPTRALTLGASSDEAAPRRPLLPVRRRASVRVATPASAPDKAPTSVLAAAGKVSAAASEESASVPASPKAVKTRSSKTAPDPVAVPPASVAAERINDLLSRAGK